MLRDSNPALAKAKIAKVTTMVKASTRTKNQGFKKSSVRKLKAPNKTSNKTPKSKGLYSRPRKATWKEMRYTIESSKIRKFRIVRNSRLDKFALSLNMF